jgi:hypothetical protein
MYSRISNVAIRVTISDRRLGYVGLISKTPKIRDQQDFSKMDMFFQKRISFWARHISTHEGRYSQRTDKHCDDCQYLHHNDSFSDNVCETVMCCDGKD